MALAGFISKIVTSITRTTFQFNKTLDVLIDRFKDACPTTDELRSLIDQKNLISNALEQINQKIATLNKVAKGSEIAADALSKGKTLIKQIPIPSSVPPGVGLPLSIMNNFSDALDNLGTLIDKEKASLETIPDALDLIKKDVGEVITKLNEFSVALDICLEKDPNITQEDLDEASEPIVNIDDVVVALTNEDLEDILTTPPGLLYGDYYLRKEIIPTVEEFSFNKKQIIAQNKESVIDGDFYNSGYAIEELLGDESFSSSNIVLVNEMKWLIDTKDLIFPPPEPAEDPLKAIYKENQIIILMSLFGANREEAEELYELAWELSQNKGPTAFYYPTLVQEAFDNSRTILEQAVANEGYEWQQGDRVLDTTIKRLFLADFSDDDRVIAGQISSIRKTANGILEKAKEIGGNYDPTSKRWDNEINFVSDFDIRLYPYAQRLALASENQSDNYIGSEFISLKPEMAKRKPLFQAVFEVANLKFLSGIGINFNDPLKDYFSSKGFGYNQPIINEIPISGNANEVITSNEINNIYQSQIIISEAYFNDNFVLDETLEDFLVVVDGENLFYNDLEAYSKTQVFLKLLATLGLGWYNANAQAASELPFWGILTTGSSNLYMNDPNRNLDPSNPWYFEFGRHGLPVPTGS